MFKKENKSAVASAAENYASTSQNIPSGAGDAKDHSRPLTLDELRQGAAKGVPICMTVLGIALLFGDEIEKDTPEAVRLFTQAAEMGESVGIMFLGYTYLVGEGVEENQAEAMRLLTNFVELGYLEEMTDLGIKINVSSEAGKKDEKAVKLLNLAVNFGSPKAMFFLGGAYIKGLGVEVDYSAGIDWFEKAAHAGYAPAQALFGKLLLQRDGADGIVEHEEISRYLGATEIELHMAKTTLLITFIFAEHFPKFTMFTIFSNSSVEKPAAKNKKQRSGNQDTKRKAR